MVALGRGGVSFISEVPLWEVGFGDDGLKFWCLGVGGWGQRATERECVSACACVCVRARRGSTAASPTPPLLLPLPPPLCPPPTCYRGTSLMLQGFLAHAAGVPRSYVFVRINPPRGPGARVVPRYRGTSLIRNHPTLAPFSRFVSRALWLS